MELLKKIKSKFQFLKVISALVRIGLTTFWIRLVKQNKKIIYFIATPIYSNLGDQAIVYAQRKLLTDVGLGDNIVEVTTAQYYWLREKLRCIIKKDDIIIIDGGGNMGTLWMVEEKKMRQIVEDYPQNPIFIFPQTVFFENSEWGEQEILESERIYNSHGKITLFCRDESSLHFARKHFTSVRSFYTPDIVLYLDGFKGENNRDNVKLCFRDDKEKCCDDHVLEAVKQFCADNDLPYLQMTTHCFKRLNFITRKYYLEKKWDEIGSSKLVITDRLHGMIFCALTGTPCIAIDNRSHKVKEGYSWIKYLPYICFCESSELIYEKMNEMSELMDRKYFYNKAPLEKYYTLISNEVKMEFEKA